MQRLIHNHDIDGKLHEDCLMCAFIRARQPLAARDKAMEQALDRHQAVAERSRLGRDVLAAQPEAEETPPEIPADIPTPAQRPSRPSRQNNRRER